MSYDFTNDRMTGSLTTGIDVSATGLTIATFVKVTGHPASQNYMVTLSSTTSALGDDVCCIQFHSTADGYRAQVYADEAATQAASVYSTTDGTYDNVWVPVVAVFLADNDRKVYVDDIANVGSTNNNTAVTTTLTEVDIGTANTGGGGMTGNLAEVAIWNTALTTQQITDYLNGNAASGIAASNLRGYWDLDEDYATTATNEGLDDTGNLTITGAVYDGADHPTISSGVAPPDVRVIVPTGPVIP